MMLAAAEPPPSRRRRQDGLTAHDLEVGYRSGPVVHDARLQVEPGRITALVGPNGSGKSTLLRAMARLHPTSAGTLALTASVDGGPAHPDASEAAGARDGDGTRDACALSRREFAQRVAMLTQQRPTPDGVTVQDLVGYGRNPHQGRFRRHDPDGPAIVARAMAVTGVGELADRRVDELSGGQLQRVWLAGCLAQDTGILLLDEPTNHLDLRYQSDMLDLMVDLARDGSAVGVVLHDLNHAAAIADQVVLLHRGRVYATGSPREVLTAETLTAVYEVPVVVHTDPVTGIVTTRTLGRHERRRMRPPDRPDHVPESLARSAVPGRPVLEPMIVG
jgi:iron complex transport system ATP-binding protein